MSLTAFCNRMRRGWERNFLRHEMILGLVTGLLCGVPMNEALRGNRATFYAGLAAIFASLLGFAIATVTILISIVQAPRMQILRESTMERELWRTFKSANRWLATAMLASIVAFPLDRENASVWWVTTAVVMASAVALARLLRCLWALHAVLASLVTKAGDENTTDTVRRPVGPLDSR